MNKKNAASKKLYKVTLRGTIQTVATRMKYGISYVVASDTVEAYNKVKKFLDDKSLGFVCERELEKIELIADANSFNNVGTMLFLCD